MFETDAELDFALSHPTPEVVDVLGRLAGDILLLGVGGKMGLSLARMARRASDLAGVPRKVIGVSRFRTHGQTEFEACGITTITCDLLDEHSVEQLPDAPNVIAMAGMKFGSSGNEPLTWAMNAYMPAIICRRFRNSRIVAFSTGNIYGLTDVKGIGSKEADPPCPVGEYAMSCLGRERIYQYFSQVLNIPLALIRLNYACDLRYGVLVDLALKIWKGEPIDLGMGYFNTIWQGDANAMVLRAFELTKSPSWIVNVTGEEKLLVRDVCQTLARKMGRDVVFTGLESTTALLSDSTLGFQTLGRPTVSASELIEWVANWVLKGGRSLGKPTHFESRDGQF